MEAAACDVNGTNYCSIIVFFFFLNAHGDPALAADVVVTHRRPLFVENTSSFKNTAN